MTTRSGAKTQYAEETKPITKANSDSLKSRAHCRELMGGGGAAFVGLTRYTEGMLYQAATAPMAALIANDRYA
ncbi:MAG: hypothetical protein R3276_16925, partial [Marinobacter sp.]|nr:hypothetical protein [Marinobacter sp.]